MSIVYDTPENKKLRGLIKSLRAESKAKDTELTQLKADLQGYHDNAKALDERDRYWQGVAEEEEERADSAHLACDMEYNALSKAKDTELARLRDALSWILEFGGKEHHGSFSFTCEICDKARTALTPEEGADKGGGK